MKKYSYSDSILMSDSSGGVRLEFIVGFLLANDLPDVQPSQQPVIHHETIQITS